MTKTIDTLISDIEELFKGATLSDHLDHFSNNLTLDIRSKFEEYLIEREPKLRLSSVGKPLRQIWYELKGYPKEVLSPAAKFKFLYGSILEHLLIFLAIEAGHYVSYLQAEVNLDGIVGHIDCIIDGVLVDVKSASTYSFNKFNDGSIRNQDPFGYIGQLAGYSKALGDLNGAFLVVDKTLGKLCLCRFDKEELIRYNISNKIAEIKQSLESNTPPLRCYEPVPVSKKDQTGNLILSIPCSYCAFKETCWLDANNGEGIKPLIYSTGPKYFVDIKKMPRLNSDIFPTKEEDNLQ